MQKIYTVIHASDAEQIHRNVERSIDGGSDGVFIINHAGISVEDMLEAFHAERREYPNFFFGLNILDVANRDAFVFAQGVNADALWLDESYIRHYEPNPNVKGYTTVHALDDLLAENDIDRKLYYGKYFGSVAFKTHGHCKDPVATAMKAIGHVDVLVTSGPGTGQAPEIEKIAAMKTAIGELPLAIASGITPL